MEDDLWQTPDADAYIEWAEQYTDAQRAQMTTLKPFLAGCRAASARLRRLLERCLEVVPDGEEILIADLKRELGKEG